MIFAFSGLLYLQFNYIQIILNSRKSEFNEAVKRSLYQVSRDLELDEAGRYLEDQLLNLGTSKTSKSTVHIGSGTITQNQKIQITTPGGVGNMELKMQTQITQPFLGITPSQGKAGGIADKSQEMQGAMQDIYFYYKSLMNEVIQNLINSNLRPIEDRVNEVKLDTYLKAELINNGLELPYQFALIDKNKNVIFSSHDFNESEAISLFTQILFPKDPPSRLYTLQVYFPNQKEYLFNSIQLIAPSIGFTIVLLVVFILTIWIVFRQKRLSEMKTDFINNMTHELKTPVSTISLAGQMLKDVDMNNSPETFRHISGVIQDESKRLGFLVEKVLQMSLFDANKTTLKPKELDANDLLINISNTFALKVERFGGELDLDLEAMESTIYVDEMHFTNVLFNLMDNAVKYKREDVPLKLVASTYNEGDYIFISIKDNGIGVKKEHLKKLFDRFYRVPTGNVHDVKGFGLGLAYVKKIVDDSGGSIKADSGVNVGTNFIIKLPYIKR